MEPPTGQSSSSSTWSFQQLFSRFCTANSTSTSSSTLSQRARPHFSCLILAWKCCHRDPAVPHFWLPLDAAVPSLLVLLPSPVLAYWSRVRSTQGEPVDRLQVTNELDLLQQPHFGLDVLSGSLELLSLHQASADFFPTGECSPLPLASSGSVMC